MRSQLDCQDHRLPGTGVFDIKTRASLSIRMDLFNFEVHPFFFSADPIAISFVAQLGIPHREALWPS